MTTILINGEDRVINLYLESKIDPNGSFVLPYYYESSDKIAQIEATLADNELFITGKPTQKYVTNTVNISTLEEVKAHFLPSPEKYFIQGVTDSKFSLLDLSYPKNVALKQNRVEYIRKERFVDNTRFFDDVKIFDGNGPIETPPPINIRKERFVDNTRFFDDVKIFDGNGPIETPPPRNIRVGKRVEISGTNVVGMILLESDARIEYVLYLDTPNPILYVDNANGNTIFKYMRNNLDEVVRPGLNYYSDMVDEPKVLSEVFIDRGTNNAFEPMRKLKNVKDLNELVKTGFGYYKINTRGYNFKDK